MPVQTQRAIHPPLGGVNRQFGYQNQRPYSSVDSLNVFSVDWSTGRDRVGVRPGLTATVGDIGTAPAGWCEATWLDTSTNPDTVRRGVATVDAAGSALVSVDAVTWSNPTGGALSVAASDGASVAVYLQQLFACSLAETNIKYSSLTTAATTGSLSGTGAPDNCSVLCACMDRLWAAGSLVTPHVLYACKIGDATTWDTSEGFEDSAYASGGIGGIINEPITALFPLGDHCLGIGCTDSMYALNGNPLAGGRLYKISNEVGPLNNNSWCKDAQDNLYFLSRFGVYKLPAGCPGPETRPQPFSHLALPAGLMGINPATSGTYSSLVYDHRFGALHVFVDQASTANDSWHMVDVRTGAFWPCSSTQSGAIRMGAVLKAVGSSTKGSALLINADGAVFQLDTASTESVDSYVWLGPFMLGPGESEGKWVDIDATLAENSGSVQASFYIADSPVEAYHLPSATFTAPVWTRTGTTRLTNYRDHVLRSGRAGYIKLEDVSSADWAVPENMTATFQHRAPRRVGK
jgi:hypothetical protein